MSLQTLKVSIPEGIATRKGVNVSMIVLHAKQVSHLQPCSVLFLSTRGTLACDLCVTWPAVLPV